MKSDCPTWFKVVAALAILWNAAGVFAFYTDITMSDAAVAALAETEQALRAQFPAWIFGAYAVAVIGGLVGSVLLIMRRSVASPVLSISLVAVLFQFGYTFLMTDALAIRGASSAIMPAAIVIIGAFLLWLSVKATREGWSS